jgi:hypothetical protein
VTRPPAGRPPGPLADDLLRVVLHVGQGSLPRYGMRERAGAARRLDVVLRAALFCDLARAGLISGTRGPVAEAEPRRNSAGGGASGQGAEAGGGDAPRGTAPGGSSDGVGNGVAQDQILSAVLAAVAQRPGVAWPRWFRHVRDDRSALVARLVGSGRWIALGGHRFRDVDPLGAERLQARTFTVSELVEAPLDERETVLGYLYALTGPTMTPEHVLGWEVRLARLDLVPGGASVRAVLAAARAVNRRGRFSRR